MKVSRGYTLLEMLVVLLMLGLVSGLAVPRLAGLYDRMLFNLERDDVIDQISRLSFLAYREGRAFELLEWPEKNSNARNALPREFSLPDGWRVSAKSPVRFLPSGVCSGGEVTISRAEEAQQLFLQPPRCRGQ